MNKRERILALGRTPPDGYTPAAFFLHFPPGFHSGPAAVDKHEEFFRFTEMDLVKVQFELAFPSVPLETPRDWEQFPALVPDHFRPQLEVVEGVVERLGREAVVVLTLYSPFMIAGGMVGHAKLDAQLRNEPELAVYAIRAVAASLLPFVRSCADAGLDGFYMSTQGGESKRFHSPSIFERYIKPTDLEVMRVCDEVGTLNILHICDYHRAEFGAYENLAPFREYPGQVVNVWSGRFAPAEIEGALGRPFMGGMDRLGSLSKGPIDAVRRAAQEALAHRPAILAADCTVPGNTPWENLREAVRVAHERVE